MGRQKIEILVLTVTATAEVAAERFVTLAGAYPAAGAQAFGVSNFAAKIGQQFPAITLGTAPVTSGAAIQKGQYVECDATGRAVPRVAGAVCGFALEAAGGAGQPVEIFLISGGTLVGPPIVFVTAGAGGLAVGQAVAFTGQAAGAGAGNAGVPIIGTALAAGAQGAVVPVQCAGDAPGIIAAGQNVAAGAALKTAANGQLIAVALGAGTTENPVARALSAVNANGGQAVNTRVLLLPSALVQATPA